MAATKYTFSIEDDFPNHKVATDRLTREIQASAIVMALDRIDTAADVCDVWFKDALAAGDVTILNGLVAAHSGEALPVAPLDPEGVPYVSLLLGEPGLKLCIKGIKFDAVQNTVTNGDVAFSEKREIQGSWFEVVGHEPGDYIEMFLVAGETVVGQFGETVYVPPSGQLDQIVAEGTVSFPAGVKIRLAYTAVSAGTTRTVYGWHRMRK